MKELELQLVEIEPEREQDKRREQVIAYQLLSQKMDLILARIRERKSRGKHAKSQ
jgi:hypothetical protein